MVQCSRSRRFAFPNQRIDQNGLGRLAAAAAVPVPALARGGGDFPIFMTAIPVGNTLRPGQFSTAGRRLSAAPALGNVSAYDPATGELAWRTELDGGLSAGTLSTAGNLVFTAERRGTFFALDAATGELLWQFHTGASVSAAQITYQVNGVQYVTVPAGNLVLTFALLDR